MNLPEGTHLSYIVWHETWYADASRIPGDHPHLMVSAAADEGGCAWEFQIDGYDLSGPVTRVKMFMDSYAAFAQMPEFFAALEAQRPVTLDGVRAILHSLGAVDETARETPERYRTSDAESGTPTAGTAAAALSAYERGDDGPALQVLARLATA